MHRLPSSTPDHKSRLPFNLKQLQAIYEKHIAGKGAEREIGKRHQTTESTSTPAGTASTSFSTTSSSTFNGSPPDSMVEMTFLADDTDRSEASCESTVAEEATSSTSNSASMESVAEPDPLRDLTLCLFNRMQDLHHSDTLGLRPLTGTWPQKGVVNRVLEIIQEDSSINPSQFSAQQIVQAMQLSFQMCVLHALDSCLVNNAPFEEVKALFSLLNSKATQAGGYCKFRSKETDTYLVASIFSYNYSNEEKTQAISSLDRETLQTAVMHISRKLIAAVGIGEDVLMIVDGYAFLVVKEVPSDKADLFKMCVLANNKGLLQCMLEKVGKDFVLNHYENIFSLAIAFNRSCFSDVLWEIDSQSCKGLMQTVKLEHGSGKNHLDFFSGIVCSDKLTSEEVSKYLINIWKYLSENDFSDKFLKDLVKAQYSATLEFLLHVITHNKISRLPDRVIHAVSEAGRDFLSDLILQYGDKTLSLIKYCGFARELPNLRARDSLHVLDEEPELSLMGVALKRGAVAVADSLRKQRDKATVKAELLQDIQLGLISLHGLLQDDMTDAVILTLDILGDDAKDTVAKEDEDSTEALLSRAISLKNHELIRKLCSIMDAEIVRRIIVQGIEDGFEPLHRAIAQDRYAKGYNGGMQKKMQKREGFYSWGRVACKPLKIISEDSLVNLLRILGDEASSAIDLEDASSQTPLLYFAFEQDLLTQVHELLKVMDVDSAKKIIKQAIEDGLRPLHNISVGRRGRHRFQAMLEVLGDDAANFVAMEDANATAQRKSTDKTQTLLYSAITSRSGTVFSLFRIMQETEIKPILKQLMYDGVNPLDWALKHKYSILAVKIMDILGDELFISAEQLTDAMAYFNPDNSIDNITWELKLIDAFIQKLPPWELLDVLLTKQPILHDFLSELITLAIWQAHSELFRTLMEKFDGQARVILITSTEHVGRGEQTPLCRAAREGNVDALSYMLKQLSPQAKMFLPGGIDRLWGAVLSSRGNRLEMTRVMLDAFPRANLQAIMTVAERETRPSLALLGCSHWLDSQAELPEFTAKTYTKELTLLREHINRGEAPSEQTCRNEGFDHQDFVPAIEHYERLRSFSSQEWHKVKPTLYVIFALYCVESALLYQLPNELMLLIASCLLESREERPCIARLTHEGWRKHLLLSYREPQEVVEEVNEDADIDEVDEDAEMEVDHEVMPG